MSLRLRVLMAIALVLILGAAVGSALATWDARRVLREELQAALMGGRQTVRSAFEDLPRSDHPERDLNQLVATFNGNRHVIAILREPDRQPIASVPYRRVLGAPAAYRALLDPQLDDVVVNAPSGSTSIVLRAAPDNDVADSWRQFVGALTVTAAVGLAGVVLVHLLIGRALRPLGAMGAALARVGGGDYGARVELKGPKELVRLGRSFNRMTGDLAEMRRRTRVLEEQVLKLQDEERADLARDLHDEFGPHLFAANIDASMIGQALAAGKTDEALKHAKSIQASVARMQRQVRDILARLRPARLTELGFAAAIEDLVEFWKSRQPDLDFRVAVLVEEHDLPEAIQEVAYRVVQEGLSNAIRHGKPRRIEVELRLEAGHLLSVRIADDGFAGPQDDGRPRFGLVGMRERLEAVGGSLSITRGSPRGWTILAQTPLPDRIKDPAPA
ncbi:sensor histidine kinase [Phenylobacterium montanum]|uniref:HAMP domain-containing protein n=1 Tax=Phenylobacterium montanum TaxID=2823693 RepID=A0A975G241_9CAUL|nr:histidine kinase [Caulobacter sp. S6]QUD89153.1 HAMP domain-containing protein [Caulobacter sp. S6]